MLNNFSQNEIASKWKGQGLNSDLSDSNACSYNGTLLPSAELKLFCSFASY